MPFATASTRLMELFAMVLTPNFDFFLTYCYTTEIFFKAIPFPYFQKTKDEVCPWLENHRLVHCIYHAI